MLLQRMAAKVKSQDRFAVLVEFLVVVIGLFLGFQLDTWWEQRKEQDLEQVYVAELHEDFVANEENLSESMAGLDRSIRSMIVLQEYSALQTPTLGADELNGHFSPVQSMPSVPAVKRAYLNLTGSGDLA